MCDADRAEKWIGRIFRRPALPALGDDEMERAYENERRQDGDNYRAHRGDEDERAASSALIRHFEEEAA
jgi:hypothetical protein